MRDDFSEDVKRNVAARVAYRCSNPGCKKQTSGPQVDPTKAVNVGVAAHITAASPGGPRYDPTLTAEERRSITNAIWLCQSCAKLVDNDPIRFSVDVLRGWKEIAEAAALDRLKKAVEADGILDSPTSQIWNVPHPPNRFFTGRQFELSKIREALIMGGASAVTQPQAVNGLGGVGKTQTVVEYAYRWHKEYKAVLWTKADSHESLMSGFAAIARVLSLREMDSEEQAKIVESVLCWLQENSNWLLIFDNADHPKLIEDFIPSKHSGHILLTSRAKVLDSLNVITPITLGNMLPNEAAELLQKRTGRDGLDIEEAKAMAQIAKELDYFPLALEQAGAYINKTMCSSKNYLKCYFEHGLTLLEKSGAVVGRYPNSVATTWLLNFEQVEQSSQASADFLRVSAFMDPDSIPVEILVGGAKELGPSISSKLSEIDSYPLALDELIQPASDYSLVSRDLPARTYNIHRLVQAVLREQLSESDQRLWVERVIGAINETIPDPDFITWRDFERLLPHAQGCAEYIDRFNLTSEGAAHLLLIIGKYFSQRNQLNEAEKYGLRALKVSENTSDPDQVELVAQSLVNLGGVYFTKAKYGEAESILLRALSLLEKAPKEEVIAFASCLNTLAELYRTLGRYADAKKYYEQALPIWEFMLTLEHPSITSFAVSGLNNLAEFYRNTHNDKVAEALYRKVLKIVEKTFAPDHPILAVVLNNLGELFRQQGKYSKAEPHYKRAIEIHEQLGGADHDYELATSLSNLGLVYYYLGRLDEAEPLFLRSLAIEENVLGVIHPHLARGLNNLALIRTNQGLYDEAISLYERALAIWKKTLPSDHPEIARGLGNLGRVYHMLGNYAVAEPLYKQSSRIMEKAFGRYNNETLGPLTDLWLLYYEQQKSAEAKLYFDRCFPNINGMSKAGRIAKAQKFLSLATSYRRRGLKFDARKREAFAKELKKGPASQPKSTSNVTDMRNKKIGRNEPCPCGSGQKFKRCCGV